MEENYVYSIANVAMNEKNKQLIINGVFNSRNVVESFFVHQYLKSVKKILTGTLKLAFVKKDFTLL